LKTFALSGAGTAGSDSRGLLKSNFASAQAAREQKARRITLAETVSYIEETARVWADPSTMTMEFRSNWSTIIPVCVVTGRVEGGELLLAAEAGAGQAVGPDTLLAYEIVARRRLERNAATRLARMARMARQGAN